MALSFKAWPHSVENCIMHLIGKVLAVKKPLIASLLIHCAFIAALSGGGSLIADVHPQGPSLSADDWAVEYGAVEVTILPLSAPKAVNSLHNSSLAGARPFSLKSGNVLLAKEQARSHDGSVRRATHKGDDKAHRLPHR